MKSISMAGNVWWRPKQTGAGTSFRGLQVWWELNISLNWIKQPSKCKILQRRGHPTCHVFCTFQLELPFSVTKWVGKKNSSEDNSSASILSLSSRRHYVLSRHAASLFSWKMFNTLKWKKPDDVVFSFFYIYFCQSNFGLLRGKKSA